MKVGFQKWLELKCRYDGFMATMVTILMLEMAALLIFPLLCIGLGLLFLYALRWRWKKELENPPWYLEEAS